MARLAWLAERPIAHRALHGKTLVENTLGAAEAAMAGNYAIEADLQLSADGIPVVFHDHSLDRLTSAQGPIAARTLAELKTVRFRASDERIPALGELLTLVAGRTPLFLELKSRWDTDARLAIQAATELARYTGPVALMSFDPFLVQVLRERAPQLPRGIVAERHYAGRDWGMLSRSQKFSLGNLLHLGRTRPHFVAYRVQDLPAVAPLLARYALARPLLAWTVRTDADRRRARRWASQMIFEGFRP